MAGSPKKRAAREAAEREKNMSSPSPDRLGQSEPGVGQVQDPRVPAPLINVSAPLTGEVLPPTPAGADPTRTALKRAMRARAQEHAEKAILVLVANLDSKDPKLARDAANDLLAWGFGKPATEIEAGDGAQMIVIRRFGEDA